ncbi:MAG: YceI family protein, partial [Chitinophagaceae bacterium]
MPPWARYLLRGICAGPAARVTALRSGTALSGAALGLASRPAVSPRARRTRKEPFGASLSLGVPVRFGFAGSSPAAFAQKAVKKSITAAAAAAVTYKLQPQLSVLGWEGAAVTHGHKGTIQFTGGDLQVINNMVVGGSATVDMKTIKATDITDAESQGKFVGHMSSADFFDAPAFPTSTFKIISVTPIKGAAADADNATITGDMTIKGVTQKISFPAKAGVKNGIASVTG